MVTSNQPTDWLDEMLAANDTFRARVDRERLPVERKPSPYAVITCMDPRVNLECIGIPSFGSDGAGPSSVRIVRTIGGMADERSLLIGMYLAGIREWAVVMHSDCGCCLAAKKIDTIVESMTASLDADAFAGFRARLGEPFDERLAEWLKVFGDPREAVKQEVASIRRLGFVPRSMPVHGIVYDLADAKIDVVVNGYA